MLSVGNYVLMLCSRSLQGMAVSDTGLYFDGKSFAPFLKTGQLVADNHVLGSLLELFDC